VIKAEKLGPWSFVLNSKLHA